MAPGPSQLSPRGLGRVRTVTEGVLDHRAGPPAGDPRPHLVSPYCFHRGECRLRYGCLLSLRKEATAGGRAHFLADGAGVPGCPPGVEATACSHPWGSSPHRAQEIEAPEGGRNPAPVLLSRQPGGPLCRWPGSLSLSVQRGRLGTSSFLQGPLIPAQLHCTPLRS